MGVHRDSNNFSPEISKFFSLVGIANDLSGADIGEVERIEDQDEIFVFEAIKTDFLEGLVGHDSLSPESRGLLPGHESGNTGNSDC